MGVSTGNHREAVVMDVILWAGTLTVVALLLCLVAVVSIPVVMIIYALVDDWRLQKELRKRSELRKEGQW